ncbi:carboxylesterase 1C [Ceratitis capitata]|nr:carboxylesterase 1C [Ceratitis capitata]
MGLKIFPDTSRTAVYAFLGVPYAEPPIGELRFAPPVPHKGWNRTLQARSMRPLCPQPSNSIYDEIVDGTLPRGSIVNEDCLYLNIWVSETANAVMKAVLVVITGEEMIYDWSQNRLSGVDLALENVIVVSVQYRNNIFGWLAIDDGALAGNLGLQDQRLALLWIQHNIQNFGGNPNGIILLGHGTGGAPCALAHTLLNPFGDQKLITKLILMSGGDFSGTLSTGKSVVEASNIMVSKLGCQFEKPSRKITHCLRQKSISDLLNAFESIYDHRNGSFHIGPILSASYEDLIRNRTISFPLPPILIGITSNEGSFVEQRWLNLAREGYRSFRDYVNYTVVRSILRRFNAHIRDKVRFAINWFYFSGEANESVKHLLYSMQRLISEFFYEMPFYRLLKILTTKEQDTTITTSVFAYVFDVTKSMDMRGKVNYFGGASHSSDLLLLLGPSMFQQVSRRRLSAEEDYISRNFRKVIINFITSGSDTSTLYFKSNKCFSYTMENPFICSFNEAENGIQSGTKGYYFSDFLRNSNEIDKILQNVEISDKSLSRGNRKYTGRNNDDERGFYAKNQTEYGYVMHLKRVYHFWQIFVQNIPFYGTENDYDNINAPSGQQKLLKEAAADAARYRKGFFALMILVVLLLGVLAMCVYILHRDQIRERTQASVSRL